MSGLINSSGKPISSETKKYKIHELELPFIEDNVKMLISGCVAISIQQTPQGPQPAISPGFDQSAAVVFLETARALEVANKRLSDLETEIEKLKQAQDVG